MGDNPCLNSRGKDPGGRAMPRHKIFIQKGDPAVVGVRQYQYTGKHNRVDLVHFDIAKVPQLQSAVHKYDESLPDGIAKSNHYIGTMYLNGKDCIAEHSDSTDTLVSDSLITVVKLGPGTRRFIIKEKATGKVLFNDLLAPGSAVSMTIRGNALTTHQVPVDPEETEMSGSIVFRTSAVTYSKEQVLNRVEQSNKTITNVVRFKEPVSACRRPSPGT